MKLVLRQREKHIEREGEEKGGRKKSNETHRISSHLKLRLNLIIFVPDRSYNYTSSQCFCNDSMVRCYCSKIKKNKNLFYETCLLFLIKNKCPFMFRQTNHLGNSNSNKPF